MGFVVSLLCEEYVQRTSACDKRGVHGLTFHSPLSTYISVSE